MSKELTVIFRSDREILEWLEKHCDLVKKSKSEIIRRAIKSYLLKESTTSEKLILEGEEKALDELLEIINIRKSAIVGKG